MSLSGPTLWGQLPFDLLSRIIKQSVGAKECHKRRMNPVLSELLTEMDGMFGLWRELLTLLNSHIHPDRWDTQVALCEIIERIEIEVEIDQDGNGWDILHYTPPNLATTLEPLQPGEELDDDLDAFVSEIPWRSDEDSENVVEELYYRLQREFMFRPMSDEQWASIMTGDDF